MLFSTVVPSCLVASYRIESCSHFCQSQIVKDITIDDNACLARIDKISLLTPRAELAATVGVAGITYLNVPATDLGGLTVPANVTINTATVYDDYLDLAGTASYNGQTYAFNLSGDVYRSILGTPSDKVGRLSDLTNTFDVLYFAVRQQPLMPIANPTLTGPNLALYLQRRGTREVVFVDVPLAGGLGTTFGTLFSLAGQYGTLYVADYWHRGLFQPTTSFAVDVFSSDPAEKRFRWVLRFEGEDCTVVEEIKFRLFTPHPGDVAVGSITYESQLWVVSSTTNGEVTAGVNFPSGSCDTFDSQTGTLALGGKPSLPESASGVDPNVISVKFVTSGNGNLGPSGQGDLIYKAISAGVALRYTDEPSDPAKVLAATYTMVDLGIKAVGSPLALSDVLPLFQIPPETQPTTSNDGLVNEWLISDGDNDSNTVIKTILIPWNKVTLTRSGHSLKGGATVTCKRQNQATVMPLLIRWHIPVVDTIDDYKVIKEFNPFFNYIQYSSGPCNR